VRLVNRVGVRIYLSVGRGGVGAANFAVDGLRSARSATGQEVVVATVRNTGGRTLVFSGSLTLSDGPGGLRTRPLPVELGAALAPNHSRQATVPIDSRLPRGPWRVHLKLRSGPIQRTAEATITFARPAPAAIPQPAEAAPQRSKLATYGVIGFLSVLLVAGMTVLLRRGASGIRQSSTDSSLP
jgi:hypothetical protein